MIIYIIVILAAVAIFIISNYFFFMPVLGFSIGYNFLGVLVSVAAVLLIDGIIAFIFHKLQDKHIKPFSKYFAVSKREKVFLEKLGVRYYKKLLPDLGVLAKFPKGKIADPKSKEYIYRYILESCSGELNHLFSMFLGFLIIFIFPLKYYLCFGIPVAIVNFILNMLPLFSLRYNRHKLMNLYNILDIREKRTASGNSQD